MCESGTQLSLVFALTLQADLAKREMALIVEENLKELLDRIRTPEQIPSPVNTYLTEEDLFHRKNPGVRSAIGYLG